MPQSIICIADDSYRKFACVGCDSGELRYLGGAPGFDDEIRISLDGIRRDGLSVRSETLGTDGMLVGFLPIPPTAELYVEAVCEYFRARSYWAQAFDAKRAELWKNIMLIRPDEAEMSYYLTTINAISDDKLDALIADIQEAHRELSGLAKERREGLRKSLQQADAVVQKALEMAQE